MSLKNTIITDHPDVIKFVDKFDSEPLVLFEQSVKMTRFHVTSDRVAVGILPKDMPKHRVTSLMREYGATADAILDFANMYDDQTTILGISIECDHKGTNYRFYVEHIQTDEKIAEAKARGETQLLTTQAVKWSKNLPAPHSIGDYFLQFEHTEESRKALIENTEVGIYPKMCKYENTQHVGNDYYCTNRQGTPRKSFYIDLGPNVYEVSDDVISFNPNCVPVLEKFKGKNIELMAGGTTPDDFLTVYYRYRMNV